MYDDSDGRRELRSFLGIMRRNLLLALVVGASCGLIAFVGSPYLPPRFEAEATLGIAPTSTTGGLSEMTFVAPTTDASAYVMAASSSSLLSAALAAIGLDSADAETLEAASDRISVKAVRGTESDLLSVVVVDRDASSAAALANAMSRELIEFDRRRAESILEEVIATQEGWLASTETVEGVQPNQAVVAEQNDRLQRLRTMRGTAASALHVLTTAEVPLQAAEPRPIFNAVVAFVTVLIATLSIAVLGPTVWGRLQSGEEAADTLRTQLLAQFQRSRNKATNSERMRRAAAYAAAKISGSIPKPTSRLTVTVATPRQSDQAAMFSLGIAIAFADQGYRTLFIDSDLRDPMTFERPAGLARPTATLGEALRAGQLPTRPMSLSKGKTHLDVIPGSRESDDAPALMAAGLPLILQLTASRYDVVVLNSTPLLTAPDALPLLSKSDFVVMVIDADAVPRSEALESERLIRDSGGRLGGIVYSSRYGNLDRGQGRRQKVNSTRATLYDWVATGNRESFVADGTSCRSRQAGLVSDRRE